MSRIEYQDCNCIDYPCCGCGPGVALTGEDADAFTREEDDFYPGEDMDGDHDSAMASAGFGTDEDYGCFGDIDGMYEDQFDPGF